MNSVVFGIFIVLFVVFTICAFSLKKISIAGIFKKYLRNYYSNAAKERDRKFNWFMFIILGLIPYVLGTLLFFSFKDFFLAFDSNLLFQIDIILLTIFCLFIGFDFKSEGKEEAKSELIATLLINILFIVVSVIILLLANSIELVNESQSKLRIIKDILFAIYYSLAFKIFVMFFYSLKRIFIFSRNI